MLVGLRRSTPLYYPDEYIYTAIARSIAATGVPSLRGAAFHFPSVLVSYLTAPAWLISDVSSAFHVVVGMGGIAFSAAVFPAYVLARRVGISPLGGLAVALVTVLVPDAAFATCALTEPYAFPLFLTTLVVAVDAVVSPTRFRQSAAVVLMAALCVVRVQFLVIPLAYLIATIVREGGSWRRALRAHPAVIGVGVVGLVGAIVATTNFYSGVLRNLPEALRMGPWIPIELFALAIASGWALVPGALVGFRELIRSGNVWRRTFAVFSACASLLIVLESAYFDAAQHRIHERYTFYATPLLAIGCVFAVQRHPVRRGYSLIAYALAFCAIAIPATSWFHDADPSQAPAILALQTFGTGVAQLVWAVLLSLIAVAVAQGRSARWAPFAVGACIAGILCVGGTRVLLRYAPIAHPGGSHNIGLYELHAPSHSALVTWAGTDRFVLMKTLFWTRGVSRVLVLGGGPAADGFGSQPVMFGRRGIVDLSGQPVDGPFAFDLATTALSAGSTSTASRWLPRSPDLIALGLNREDGYLATATQIIVAPVSRARIMLFVLRSGSGRKQLTFDCGGLQDRVDVGASRPVTVRVPVQASATVRRCRVSLTRGSAVDHDGTITSGVRVLRFVLTRAPTS